MNNKTIALPDKVWTTVRCRNMLKDGDTVLVAVSGGADSMTLLTVLGEWREQHGLTVLAAHINHGIRGEEALRDQRLVEQQCERMGVPLFVHSADVPQLATQWGVGLEEAGRRVRYAFFEEIADRYTDCRIATAHTASDHAETVLMNLTRGTGLNGLGGIPPMRGRIIRPLLDCTREEIEAFCRKRQVPYVIDSTNTDTRYTRNRIRAEVIPSLRELNPQLESALRRMSDGLREDEEYLRAEAETLLSAAEVVGDASAYDRTVLATAPAPLRTRALWSAASKAGAHPEQAHLHRLNELLTADGAITLPGDVTAIARGQRLCFTASAPEEEYTDREFPIVLGTPCEIDGKTYPLPVLSMEEFEKKRKVYKFLLYCSLDCDKIKGNAFIRFRRDGDEYRPVNRGSKTLKKLFNEAGLSDRQRRETALLCDEEGILFVEGFGCAERVRLDEGTKRVLLFGSEQRLASDTGVCSEDKI